MYADDVVLLATTPDDLRAQLAEAQAFADESSYEYSMDKSQVVVFGGPDPQEKVTLMGQEMQHVAEYKYLGLVFHRSLGRLAGRRLGELDRKERSFCGKKFVDNDGPSDSDTDGDEQEGGHPAPGEERVVDSVYDRAFEDGSVGYVAVTKLVDGVSGRDSTKEYYLESGANEAEMKRMIDAYNLAHGVSQADEKPKSAWDGSAPSAYSE